MEMDLESLYDFRGQIEMCLSRAEHEAKDESSKLYRPLLNSLVLKLQAAINILDIAIKDKAEKEPPQQLAN